MNVVIKVNDEIKEKMIEYYKDKRRDKVIPYVVFQAQDEDTVITMYESGKVMFQGTSADVDAAMWGVALENTKEKKEEDKDKYVTILETWESEEHLKAHLATPHMAKFRDDVKDLRFSSNVTVVAPVK